MRSIANAQACCLQNVAAWLWFLGLPPLTPLATRQDRVFFARDADFLRAMDARQDFERWDAVTVHGATAVRGWRERRARCSAQVIEHTGAVEIDFDLYNPNHGLLPALGHLVEVLVPGKTNPLRVRRLLAKRGIRVVA